MKEIAMFLLVIVVIVAAVYVTARNPLVSEIESLRVELDTAESELSSVPARYAQSFYVGVTSACVVFVTTLNNSNPASAVDPKQGCAFFTETAREQQWYTIAKEAELVP